MTVSDDPALFGCDNEDEVGCRHLLDGPQIPVLPLGWPELVSRRRPCRTMRVGRHCGPVRPPPRERLVRDVRRGRIMGAAEQRTRECENPSSLG
jgi:hypothetical protein